MQPRLHLLQLRVQVRLPLRQASEAYLKTVILASLAALAVAASASDLDGIRSQLEASLGWDRHGRFAFNFHVVVNAGA